MTADILSDTSFPHGTPGGFKQGCHGAHCPAVIPCRDVHTRYNGDFRFRRLFDAGLSLAGIVEAEQQAARDALATKRAASGTGARSRKTGRSDRRPAVNRGRADGQRLIPYNTLKRLLADGLTDRQIADLFGLTRRQVTGTRNMAGLERNPARRGRTPKAPTTSGPSH